MPAREVEAAWGLDRVGISFAAAMSDLDRDGDLDLVVGNLGERASVYRNDGASGRRVLIRLVGKSSNRYGIGCTVRVHGPFGVQACQLTTTRGFMSSNEQSLRI